MSVCISPQALRWRVVLSRQADDALMGFEEDIALQVLTAIGLLATCDNPTTAPNVRALKLRERTYRLRSGKYRVLFHLEQHDDVHGSLCVDSIEHRNSCYEP